MTDQFEYAIVEWLWDVNSLKAYLPGGRSTAGKGSYAEVVQFLSNLGKDGWEVAGNTSTANWVFWTLKRRLS